MNVATKNIANLPKLCIASSRGIGPDGNANL
jgi:hypothetical protein